MTFWIWAWTGHVAVRRRKGWRKYDTCSAPRQPVLLHLDLVFTSFGCSGETEQAKQQLSLYVIAPKVGSAVKLCIVQARSGAAFMQLIAGFVLCSEGGDKK
jgi:hypothetical protein